MTYLISKLYELLPKNLINIIGSSKFLKPLREFLLRDGNNLKLLKSKIFKQYESYTLEFEFIAPIKISTKAKSKGVETTLLKNSIKLFNLYNKTNNPVIFDVGANFGFLSLVWAKSLLESNGILYSFEPNLFISNVLNKNIKINQLSHKIFQNQVAIGNKNGKVNLYISNYSSNTVAYDDTNITRVDIIKLDSFVKYKIITNVDMIKIDVDGIEFDILQGAKNILKKHMPILIIETNSNSQIIEFCISLGYVILNMDLQLICENEIPENIFCVDEKIYHKNY